MSNILTSRDVADSSTTAQELWRISTSLRCWSGTFEKVYHTSPSSVHDKSNQWCLLVSQNGDQNSLMVHQDIALYASQLTDAHELSYHTKQNRSAYLQLALGSAEVNGKALQAGDAALFDADETIQIKALGSAEVLLFDLPKAY